MSKNPVALLPIPVPRIEVVYLGKHSCSGWSDRKVDQYEVMLMGFEGAKLRLKPDNFDSKNVATNFADFWATATGFPVLHFRRVATTTYHLEPDQETS